MTNVDHEALIDRIKAMANEHHRTSEVQYLFETRFTPARARCWTIHQAHFVRNRRDCWAHVSANCPVMGVKQKILEHEYEEIIRDDFSDYGHLHLIIRQGKSVGLETEEIINAEPLLETRATLYAWSWMTSEMPWTQSLAGMTITEPGVENDQPGLVAFDYLVCGCAIVDRLPDGVFV